MQAVESLGVDVGTAAACRALALPRATLYRRRAAEASAVVPAPRPTPARALTPSEREDALNVLRDERLADKAPAEVYATLLDASRYLCSVRTMYRILAGESEVRERRNQLRHPVYGKPELIATGPK